MKFIVDFHNNVSDTDIEAYLTANNCTVIKSWNNYEKVFLVESSVEPPSSELVAHIVNNETVTIKPLELVELNHFHESFDPASPSLEVSSSEEKDWWKNYSLAQPNFEGASKTVYKKGSNVHVYIMDSGILSSHEEFEGVNISYIYSITPGDFTDRNGHGTALASVIAGKTCSLTTAKLKIVKIFEPGRGTLQSELLDALDAVMGDVIQGSLSVLNCSWAIEKNAWVEYKLRETIDKGVYVVASAGNSGHPIENVTPASMPEVLTIGSYNQDLKPSDFSDYSNSLISVTNTATNYGMLDGWAPGEKIWCAGISNDSAYGFSGGTSLSAAIVSSVIAYNLSDYVRPDGTLLPPIDSLYLMGPEGMRTGFLQRKDLLDLSDPKYATSANVIATFRTSLDRISQLPPDEFDAPIRVGERKDIAKICIPKLTKSLELLDPLPPNFEVTHVGTLLGYPSEEQGPSNGETYVQHTVRFKRISIDDIEETVTARIYILSPNYQPTDLPEDHVVNIKLQVGGCGDQGYTNSCSFQTNPPCSPVNCIFVCCDPKGGFQLCICLFSDRRLKSNIVKIGTHKLGIGIYEYTIFGEKTTGVMADEVLEVLPSAVIKGQDGYYRVNYTMLNNV